MTEEVVPKTPEELEAELFLQDWVECGFNATEAYLKRHPHVTRESAAVMGARQLGKVKIDEVMEARGLGKDLYFKKLHEGLEATRLSNSLTAPDMLLPDYKTRRDYHKALGKVLSIETDKVEHEVAGELIVKTVKYADNNDPTPV